MVEKMLLLYSQLALAGFTVMGCATTDSDAHLVLPLVSTQCESLCTISCAYAKDLAIFDTLLGLHHIITATIREVLTCTCHDHINYNVAFRI